ncbi:type II secretion system protein [Mangrovimicrobium sediminis]|uniref:Type II secretion system protein n=1 Tax=Mangrovimicrobium sediminis TaxID=2562682 RepID=A0A4Z0M8K7_9GAMM|nr:type II secretion system protein [Haliea sp. SAOS-164]TGD75708.1 type II secretion system protein [Haliea sp. SAOS-164]
MQPSSPGLRQGGFTLLEVLIAVAIGSIVLTMGMSAYTEHQKRVRLELVVADMKMAELAIFSYFQDYQRYPPSLADVGFTKLDPWGNPYQYLNIANAPAPGKGKGKGGVGKMRKDKNLVPINSDYDLYSMGPDGRSVGPLTAKPSRDDIVRANNGAFIGLAADY